MAWTSSDEFAGMGSFATSIVLSARLLRHSRLLLCFVLSGLVCTASSRLQLPAYAQLLRHRGCVHQPLQPTRSLEALRIPRRGTSPPPASGTPIYSYGACNVRAVVNDVDETGRQISRRCISTHLSKIGCPSRKPAVVSSICVVLVVAASSPFAYASLTVVEQAIHAVHCTCIVVINRHTLLPSLAHARTSRAVTWRSIALIETPTWRWMRNSGWQGFARPIAQGGKGPSRFAATGHRASEPTTGSTETDDTLRFGASGNLLVQQRGRAREEASAGPSSTLSASSGQVGSLASRASSEEREIS